MRTPSSEIDRAGTVVSAGQSIRRALPRPSRAAIVAGAMTGARVRPVLTIAAVLVALVTTRVEARICGDGIAPCHCQDTVRGRATLTADLGPCGPLGLKVPSGAVLDCAGHTILRGDGELAESYGVKLDDAIGATVRNCVITQFRRGIRVRGGERNVITANVLVDNEYGIDVGGATSAGMAIGHRIVANVVRRSHLDGIHLGWGTHEAFVADNEITDSGEEQLYVLYNEGSVIANNTITGPAAAGIYVKHSERNHFIGNQVRDSRVTVRGRSSGNAFAHTTIFGAGFGFETHEGGHPHDNVVVGGAVVIAAPCFRFAGAYDHDVSRVLVSHCPPAVMVTADGQPATGNVVEVVAVTEDFDRDGVANAEDPCTDRDGDGFGDPGFAAATCPLDTCPEIPQAEPLDADEDGTDDACDLCPMLFDPAQRDADRDGIGDSCNTCVNTPEGSFCDDQNLCTLDDACAGRRCVGTGTLVCDDGNPCTDDGCDPEGGCRHTPNAAACDDGIPCTGAGQCRDGACAPGETLACPAPPDACRAAGACEPDSGRCAYPAAPTGAPCDDGDACTTNDACAAGGTCRGTPRVCADDDLCTIDGCDDAGACRHEPMRIDAVTAAFATPLGAGTCAGHVVPRRIEKAFTRAAGLVVRAGRAGKSAGTGKSTRRLFRAITLLEKAGRTAGQASAQDPSNLCLANVVDRLAETYARTFCVVAGGV